MGGTKVIILLLLFSSIAFGQSKLLLLFDDDKEKLNTPLNFNGIMGKFDERNCVMFLTWDAVAGATKYYLYRDTSNNPTTLVDSTTTNTIIDIVPSGIYYYRVRASNGKIYSDYSNTVADTAYEFEYWDYQARVPTKIPDSTAWWLNKFIKNLKDSLGIQLLSEKARVIYMLANVDTNAAYTNLVGDYNKAISINDPEFTPYRGMTAYRLNPKKYLNTYFSAANADDSIGFKRYSASVGVYINSGTLADYADIGTNNVWIKAGMASGNIDVRVNSNGSATISGMTTPEGWTMAVRDNSPSYVKIYRNDSASGNLTIITWDVFDRYFLVGAYNNLDVPNVYPNYPSDRRYAFVWIGLGVSEEEARKIYNTVESALDEIGAGAD